MDEITEKRAFKIFKILLITAENHALNSNYQLTPERYSELMKKALTIALSFKGFVEYHKEELE